MLDFVYFISALFLTLYFPYCTVRFGIRSEDIYRAVSDNTNSAVLASHLVASGRKPNGEYTMCGMHSTELLMKHALGLVTRKKGNKVVDCFPEGLELIKRVHSSHSFIMDKKAKSRFYELKNLSRSMFNCEAKVLEIPNKTRVGGTHRMFESALKSKQLILIAQTNSSFSDKFSKVALKQADFMLIAEFEAVLKPVKCLALEHQKDKVGWIAFSWLNTVAAKKKLFGDNARYAVVDVTQIWKPDISMDKIPRARLKFVDLDDRTKELIGRLEKEFEHYFPNPDEDQKKAILLHPVMASLAL